MSYIPHTTDDLQVMLKTIGLSSIDQLFEDVPGKLKKHKINTELALSESELFREIEKINKNNDLAKISFLGAGNYCHYIPAVVDAIVSRSEFYTAYTPYQSEVSQGVLKAIFEYQSMICELTACDIANASMYDGASALAEAAIMAVSFSKRDEVVLANDIHPNYLQVLKTYLGSRDITIKEKSSVSDKSAALIISQPDFNGELFDYRELVKNARDRGAMIIVLTDVHLLACLEAPGKLGADIVVAEGQPLGLTRSFGGPGLGIMATKKEFSRFLPGRIVGKTTDRNGKDMYILTLQTREQHIRREKATSNICSNEALCALRATVYMSVMGPEGMKKVALLSKKRADHLKSEIVKIKGFELDNKEETYKEFVVKCPIDAKEINENLKLDDIEGGYDLGDNKMLLCCTEMTTEEDIEKLITSLKKVEHWSREMESSVA